MYDLVLEKKVELNSLFQINPHSPTPSTYRFRRVSPLICGLAKHIANLKQDQVLQNNDYERLLALYNRKSLSSQVSNSLGLANGSLPETVVRLVRGDCRDSITTAIKPYFGNFQQHMA